MGTKNRACVGSALLMCYLISSAATADEDKPAYDRIAFMVSAGMEVENDTMTAVLFARKEGPDPATLSAEVNKAIGAAMKRARQEPAVTAQTLDYQTNPTYQNGRPSGWQVRQSIRLESKSPEPLTKLIGDLQATLALGAVDYGISPGKLKEYEDKLIDEALASFRSRAERVTKDLGRSQYRIVSVQVNTVNRPPIRPSMRTATMAAEAAPAEMPPTFEPGKDRVEVEVSGTIELQPK
jgi:predicted secreted protein